jgi:sulfur carrier protein ThiS adenylyltransferase
VVFACVDAIGTRRAVWEAVRSRAAFFVDGRMAAEVLRVLAVDSPATDAYYATTLFGAGEAYAGSCTARSTIYSASIAAGLMVGQFTKWLRDLLVDADLTLNLLSMELAVAPGEPVGAGTDLGGLS